jgi:hypothetical protein
VGEEHLVAEDHSPGHGAALGDTAGWPEHDDGHFLAEREERAAMTKRFLQAMDSAGNPGTDRAFGSTVRELTGQEPDRFWEAEVRDPDAPDEQGRSVRVFTDGRHGWTDSMTYSDRPRAPEDEIPPAKLKAALGAILDEHGLSWPDDDGDDTARS